MKYMDYRMAIGELVLSGINVGIEREGNHTYLVDKGETDSLKFHQSPKRITYCFRDGSTYKVKWETIQDYCDQHTLQSQPRL
jgi:hypothetical protein